MLLGSTGKGFGASKKRYKTLSVLWVKVYENVTFGMIATSFSTEILKQKWTNSDSISLLLDYFLCEIIYPFTAEAILSVLLLADNSIFPDNSPFEK